MFTRPKQDLLSEWVLTRSSTNQDQVLNTITKAIRHESTTTNRKKNMLKSAGLLLICLLVPTIYSSVFELTDRYVNDFQDGIDRLVEVSNKTVLQEGSYKPEHFDEEAALKNAEEFDFIVIGGGSGGAVVANRLSEVPEWKVLLLEAGAPESLYAQPPSLRNILLNTPYNWGYKTEPQEKACLGANDDRCNINLGRAVGGTSAINKMMYSRGNAKDYDTWADLGNDGWCYKDVLPYFKKSEDAHLHKFDRKYHSQGGPINVEEPLHGSALREAFLEAGQELGYKIVEANGEEPIGVAVPQLVTKGGRRSSISRAYLETAKDRKNLSVRPFSQVTQILVTPHTKEANGVKYVHKGKLYVAKSKKEVILSAGPINSPQLLMLSGIGPKEQLESVGLECIEDLAVGKNLKDHVVFVGMSFVSNETITEGDQKENLISWLKEGKGPLSHTGVEALAVLKTITSQGSPDYPDIEFILIPHAMNVGYDYVKREYNIRKELYDSIWAPNEGKSGCSIFVVLPHGKSTGTVKLHTKDPLNYPIIYGNYLTDEEQADRDTLLAGIRKAKAFSETEAFKKLGLQLNSKPILSCANVEFGTDDYWKCAIGHLTFSISVPSGTCKMAPETDKEGVVDNRLKVRGIHNLRVADISVVPSSLTAHTGIPEVMIGEKAADLIKHDWK
ncbi:hypothetical protein Trydic_g2497 [Trypoxylus dichotomus]